MQYLFTICTHYYYLSFPMKSVNSETLKYSLKSVLRGTLTQPAGQGVYVLRLHNNIILRFTTIHLFKIMKNEKLYFVLTYIIQI